jgi:hypothetical protein
MIRKVIPRHVSIGPALMVALVLGCGLIVPARAQFAGDLLRKLTQETERYAAALDAGETGEAFAGKRSTLLKTLELAQNKQREAIQAAMRLLAK